MQLIGIGTDIISISRIADLIERYGARFLVRVLSVDERSYSTSYEHVAHRWAAKEAISKAIGCGLGPHCRMVDISILPDATGKPKVIISGPTQRFLDHTYPRWQFYISLSGDDYAIAMCILLVH